MLWQVDILVVLHHIFLGYVAKSIDQYMHYINKGYASLHTFSGMILVQNMSDNVNTRYVHHRDVCSVGYYMEYYKTCIHNRLCTNSEIKHLIFLLMINCVGTFL